MPKIKRDKGEQRKHARFLETLYSELVDLGWQGRGVKPTWDEKNNRPMPQNKVTFHRVSTKGTAGHDYGLKKGVLNEIYSASANVVAPRTYDRTREQQALRWISTLTYKYLTEVRKETPEEVQSAVHGGAFYIAANTDKSNEVLRGFQQQKLTGNAFLDQVLTALNQADVKWSPRETRHLKKLRTRVLPGGAKLCDYGATVYPAVSAALTGRIWVCSEGPNGLHAERRISSYLRVVPADIAGVRRPCVACYLFLFQGSGIHPGPYWPSGAANLGLDEYTEEKAKALAARLTASVGDTYVTLDLLCDDFGQVSLDGPNSTTDTVNSDSDTDDEGRTLVLQ
jgi:hypothetical protein